MQNTDILQKVSFTVHSVAPDAKIILFGSRARGDERKESDWDFLILTNSQNVNETEKQIWQNLYTNVELETGEIVTSIVHTFETWENLSSTPLYQNITKEGVLL